MKYYKSEYEYILNNRNLKCLDGIIMDKYTRKYRTNNGTKTNYYFNVFIQNKEYEIRVDFRIFNKKEIQDAVVLFNTKEYTNFNFYNCKCF
jgi:hypothetical protein